MNRFLLTFGTLFVFVLASAAVAQDKVKDKKPTEETIAALNEAVDGLKTAVKQKLKVDIVHYSKAVGEKYEGGDSKARQAAVSTLKKALKNKDSDVKSTVVEALGRTGGKAARILLKEAKGSAAKKSVTHLTNCIRAVGQLKNQKVVGDLGKFLNHKDNDVIAQAITSLGDYIESPLKLKKEIVEMLLKRYEPVYSAAHKSNPRTTDKQRYAKLSHSFEASLKALTYRTDITLAPEWGKWWRKKGKKAKVWEPAKEG